MVVTLAPATARDRGDAGSGSAPVHMDGAGATHADSATEFGAREAKLVANHPEQRRVIRTVHGNVAAIEVKFGHDRIAPVLT